MEAKYWFYIIVGGIYILSRFLKKSENPTVNVPKSTPDRPSQGQPTPQTKTKQLTFEELLREITESKELPKSPVPVSTRPVERQFTEVDYDEDLKDEIRDLEEVEPAYKQKDSVYKVYEDAKQSAFNRPSLEETLNLRNTDVRYGKFKVFEQDQQRNLLEEYTRQLQDPEGLKKAVVMSEILNRKF